MNFLSSFFDFNKNKIINEVKSECTFSFQFFILLILSAAIATLGLIVNNGVVVIGAMLLSPILYPIVGLSLSTVISDKHLLHRSAIMAISSILTTIAVAAAISMLSPFDDFNSQIMIRINPTIFDMVIALFVGVAAILIISWPKFSNHTAGVAIAASLLEPLCITGIGIAYGNLQVAYGSFMLFLTNLASVVFAGIVAFALIGFFRRENEQQRKSLELGLVLSLAVVLLIGLQLFFSLKNIVKKNTTEKLARTVLSQEFDRISENIKIESVSISNILSEDVISIESEIKVPSNITINLKKKNEIVQRLSNQIGSDVNLELRVIPVLQVIVDEKEKKDSDSLDRQIEKVIIDSVSLISSQIDVESVESVKNTAGKKYFVLALLRIPEDFEFTSYYKEYLYLSLKKKLSIDVSLEIQLIKYSRL